MSRSFLFHLATAAVQGGGAVVFGAERSALVGLVYGTLLLLGLLANLALLIAFFRRPPDWTARLQALKSSPWAAGGGARALLLLVLFFLVTGLLLQVVMAVFAGDREPGLKFLVGHSLFFHFGGTLLVLALMWKHRWSWRRAFGGHPRDVLRDFGRGFLFYLAALPFIWFYAWVFQVLLRVFGVQPTMQRVAWMLTEVAPLWMRVYLLVLAVSVAPLFEEMLFRGMGLPFLARRFGAPAALLAVSVLFAGVHFHLSSAAPLFVTALAFSLAYIHTGSLLVPVVMHGLFNGVNLVMLSLLRGG